MAKRRRRKQADPVGGIIALAIVTAFFGTFNVTKSLTTAVLVFLLLLIMLFIVAVIIRMRRMERLRRSGIAEVDKMDGLRFERYLGEMFKFYGYHTEVTQGSGDYGVDLILKKSGIKIAVQVKRYTGNVGLEAVQQVQAGKAHYAANEAWVVTNSHYTDQAVTLARSNGVRLIARDELVEMMLRMNNPQKQAGGQKASPVVPKQTPAAPLKSTSIEIDSVCGFCGGTMQQRKSNKGMVMACSNFPQCKNVQAI